MDIYWKDEKIKPVSRVLGDRRKKEVYSSNHHLREKDFHNLAFFISTTTNTIQRDIAIAKMEELVKTIRTS